MKIPTRNKISDAEFEKRSAEQADNQSLTVIPKSDEVIESEMGLAPVVKSPESISRPDAINQLLAQATLRASTLKLSKKERDDLRADFPDSDFQRGAGGDTNLLYLEHAALRNRLSDVIGLGEWSFEVIRNWMENFQAGNPPKPAVRVYIEGMLLIRGSKVGLAIGDGTYYLNNAKTNYSDAFESAKTAAFRRCAKDFGIGLQCFSKDWCEQWKKKYAGFERPEKK